jgi:hypothetical protein
MSRHLSVPVACLALAVGGCGSHAAMPATTAPASASPLATPSASPTRGGPLTLTDAVSLNQSRGLAEPSAVPVDRPGGTAGVLAVLPDASLVMVEVQLPSPTPDAELHLSQSKLEIVDPHGATVQVPGHDGALPRQAIWAAGDADTVVWLETPAQDKPGYAVLAYDRKARTTRVVATSDVFEPFAVDGIGFAGGRVYWRDPKSASTKAPVPIYSRDVQATGPIRRETIPDSNVALSDGNVFYTVAAPAGTAIHRRSLSSGADTVVTTVADTEVRGLVASGNDLAWNTAQNVTLRQADGTTTTLDAGAHNPPGGLVLTSDFLGFVTSTGNSVDGEWAFDRHDNQLVHLADAPGTAQVFAAGSRLVWRDGSNWQVADFNRD